MLRVACCVCRELCRYTLRVGALDVNTDSNTRQRDPCNWDSHLQALGQAVIAPAASTPYRRRSVAILFDPDAQVMVWTEFFLFTLFAAAAYSFESGDLGIARSHFDTLSAEYSCGQFVTPLAGGGSLVIKDPGQGHVNVTPYGTSSECLYGHTATACMYKGASERATMRLSKHSVVMQATRTVGLDSLLDNVLMRLL